MKKISLIMILAIATKILVAQEIGDIEKFAILGQTQKAKEALDKYMSVEKNTKKPQGWFYKGFIYNQLSKDSSLSYDASSEMKYTAFEAFKKYREIDPKATLLVDQSNSPLFDIYIGYSSELGVKAYGEKKQALAFEYFKKGIEVHDYIASNNITGVNGFSFSALDTLLVLYTAITAGESKKMDEQIKYYKILADANVAGDQYIDVYQVLVDHYKAQKDQVSFDSILEKSRKLFPSNEEYWMAIEIENAIDGAAKPALFGKYDDLMLKHPNNYTLPYNYGVELYHYIYSDENKNVSTTEYKAKLQEVIKKAIEQKATIEANFLLANFLYNNSIDISEEARKIKGPKPDDLKRKKAVEAEATNTMNSAIPYAEAVIGIFEALSKSKSSEKVNYKQSLVILRNIYEVKKNTVKIAELEKKISSAE